MRKVFIGTIGYHNLRNHSVGPFLLPQLQAMKWPAGVSIEELNWGPIAIVQRFQSQPNHYDRVILLSALERPGRKTGDVTVFRWEGGLPDEELIQRCVGDAVTGVISVENLLIIGEYFKIWPPETFLIDVEPGPEQAGPGLTKDMEKAIPQITKALQSLSLAHSLEFSKFKSLYGETLIET